MIHEAHVFIFSGAGQRNYRGQCRDCLWHGPTTSDREQAQSDADTHAADPMAGRR